MWPFRQRRVPQVPALMLHSGSSAKVVLLTAPGKAMRRKKFISWGPAPLVTPRNEIIPAGPMVRLIYDDMKVSKWHVFNRMKRRTIAIEVGGPDEHGVLRFVQLRVG